MDELVALLRERARNGKPKPPRLRVVRAEQAISIPEPLMDRVTRESHIRLIRSLRRFYKPFGIDVVIDNAMVGRGELDDLSDQELLDLRRKIDQARECISDGISFEEAGLLRTQRFG